MSESPGQQEYRPETLERRGEILAWGSALLVSGAWLVLLLSKQEVFVGVPILAVLLLLISLGISLSNWMDRHTFIIITPDGVKFSNGVRNTQLAWDHIRQVQTIPSPWGKKVRVIGDNAYFEFRTLGEVKVQGDVKGRMGFKAGERILRMILENTRLKKTKQTPTIVYYSRE